ncbi:PIG-L deacetylase family protein [Nocardioides limicola]|uniref:PIG-L deacetylase family protein n=1 Tax=Nocardioides limicola TaxID=2803368 RepID=UPI00193BC8A1|nr:PIG-L deacetylase family protein [Nocardioides sp. DJM-14]
MAAPTLATLPPDMFDTVLCVAAHPDDLEYGASAAVATWTDAGTKVHYLMLTRGEAGIDAMAPAETALLRSEEQVLAAREVGVDDVEFLDHPDGVLEYGVALRRDIARTIRRVRPDAVVVGAWEVEFMGGLNQADHRVAGMVTIDAVRDAGNRWVFTDLIDEGLQPHSPRWVLVAGHDSPTHGVALSPTALAAGVRSLEAHAGYLAALPWHPPPSELVPWLAEAGGPALGAEAATLFKVYDLQAPPGS